MLIFVLLLHVSTAFCQQSDELTSIYPDYTDHPCKRTCTKKVFHCVYNLTLDFFFTMQNDCLNCTTGNRNDCENPQCIPGDGDRRLINLYNGVFPGPAIEVCQGDMVTVNLKNALSAETTTIHYHGIKQRNRNWMDGVPFVTQCPVNPTSRFVYRFVAEYSGTFFYHSHTGTANLCGVMYNDPNIICPNLAATSLSVTMYFIWKQRDVLRITLDIQCLGQRTGMERTNVMRGSQRADGAFGPLIVKQQPKRNLHANLYDFDESEHVIMLVEWTFPTSETNLIITNRLKYLSSYNTRSILLNGFGPMPNNTVPPKRFNVQKGKRYRFRVINAANMMCPMDVSVENHKLTVISMDNNDIQPLVVDRFILMNGERVDFVLNANQKEDLYVIRISGSMDCPLQTIGIVAYENATEKEIQFPSNPLSFNDSVINCIRATVRGKCVNYDEISSLVQIEKGLLGEPDVQKYIAVDTIPYVKKRFAGVHAAEVLTGQFVNNISFESPSEPLIFNPRQGCDTKKSCNGTYCECTNIISVKRNQLVEVIFVTIGEFYTLVHPLHVHGYSYRLIGEKSVGDTVSVEDVRKLDKTGQLYRNFSFPIIKDTVAVKDGGYAIIRFRADNPGVWFIHCHNGFHSEQGMALVLEVHPILPTPPGFYRCGDYLDRF